ncbi:MAG: hypothetical protein A2277_19900 [Desulfobacterales bacterium RIFOXYA12_FULL_46_15]|nr:MAG: hypothetical protein A2277_19900 [Desulfobacterales bacterium RIFOXYA12_FULL_46_15]
MNSHNPVPFDFIPFSNSNPQTRTVDEWEAVGDLVSGSIDFFLTPLTPIHIVGKQERKGNKEDYKITMSHFNRAGHTPVIPATTLKGAIRAFFEAAFNCWVSQATEEFPAEKKSRHWGFAAFGKKDKDKRLHFGPAIPKRLHPVVKDDRIDLASFLFGNVIEPESKEACQDLAFSSRLIFEDLIVDPQDLDINSLRLPDVPGGAFMGGPKPNISNWWYFKPLGIAERKTEKHSVTEFIGGEYRGRKFYFHQHPEKITAWYDNENNWDHTTKKKGRLVNNYYTYPVEIIPRDKQINGKIFFNHIPEKILNLFLSVLQPGGKIRHKIGYGQAFGLGSIDLAIEKVTITDSRQIIPIFQEHHFAPIVSKGLAGQKEYIDNQALLWITRILSFDSLLDDKAYILSYPPYSKGFFQTPVPIDMVRRIQKENPGCTTDVIAEKLFPIKKTIDFRVYQEKSLLGDRILNRWK